MGIGLKRNNISNSDKYERISLFVTGIFLGLVFSKGGNPVIFADRISPPANFYEFIFQPYPFEWFYWILGVVALINLFKIKWSLAPRNIWALLPLFWFMWQVISSINTVDSRLTSLTLPHFFACILCYFIGFFRSKDFLSYSYDLYAGIFLGFLWVLGNGIEQHFGGLETIRQNYEQSLQSFSPEQRSLLDTYEFRVKIMSNRIFSTFIYPNAFAGGLLLLAPTMFYLLYKNNKNGRLSLKFLSYVILGLSLFCLYWSGSKAGLIVIALTIVLLLFKNWNLPKKYKVLATFVLIILVGCVFAIKYADYFHRGAKSLGARFDYWRAATEITIQHPFLGTGPGTFSIPYRNIKKPESEMAKLAHNDYIQQASDSGIPGMVLYTGFIIWVLNRGFRLGFQNKELLPIFIGLFAWSIHSFFEFHLYIPALAYLAFAFAGVLASFSYDKKINEQVK